MSLNRVPRANYAVRPGLLGPERFQRVQARVRNLNGSRMIDVVTHVIADVNMKRQKGIRVFES